MLGPRTSPSAFRFTLSNNVGLCAATATCKQARRLRSQSN